MATVKVNFAQMVYKLYFHSSLKERLLGTSHLIKLIQVKILNGQICLWTEVSLNTANVGSVRYIAP